MKLIRHFALFATAVALPLQSIAACQDGYSPNFLGICMPNFSPGPATEPLAQIHGAAIAVWFQGSRETALSGSGPVPPQVRLALTGYISEDVLNHARYKVGDNGIINAANDILKVNNDIAAVALVDVIVFRDGNDAASNYKLWAHELKHVQQFMEWGVKDFGIRYARDHNAVENQAREVENGYPVWAAAHNGPNPNPGPGYPPPPTTYAQFCVTPIGSCTMSALGPKGVSCYCPTMNGPIWGTSM